MQITITFDTDTEEGAAILALLSPKPAAVPPPVKKATAKKAAAKKAEPEPEEDEDEDEDLVGEPTRADAVARATELVAEGKAPDVKAALGELGVKRVAELKDSQIAEFLDLLTD